MATYEDCFEYVRSLLPEMIYLDSEARTFISLIAYEMSQLINSLELLDQIYNPDEDLTEDSVHQLALMVGCEVGPQMGKDALRYLVKRFMGLMKSRSLAKSVRAISKEWGRSETEVASLESPTRVAFLKLAPGNFEIIGNRVESDISEGLEFIRPAGFLMSYTQDDNVRGVDGCRRISEVSSITRS